MDMFTRISPSRSWSMASIEENALPGRIPLELHWKERGHLGGMQAQWLISSSLFVDGRPRARARHTDGDGSSWCARDAKHDGSSRRPDRASPAQAPRRARDSRAAPHRIPFKRDRGEPQAPHLPNCPMISAPAQLETRQGRAPGSARTVRSRAARHARCLPREPIAGEAPARAVRSRAVDTPRTATLPRRPTR